MEIVRGNLYQTYQQGRNSVGPNMNNAIPVLHHTFD
jgi:hypothetical protein